MARQIVLLSGHVSAGKTTLAEHLVSQFDVDLLKTKDILKANEPSTPEERGAMQALGEKLDSRTGGEWIRDGLRDKINEINDKNAEAVIIIDSVRTKKQIAAIRQAYGRGVIHIHLESDITVLKERYSKRERKGFEEFKSYDEVLKSKTEARIDELIKIADIVVRTDQTIVEDVVVRAASHLGLYGRGCDRLVDVLVGGQYGSEGKGNIVSYLAREYDVLVRVGGPNAGHKVYEEPKPYTFHLLPSGTRSNEKANLIIGPGATINVDILRKEIADCNVSNDRLSIDPQVLIIEPSDIKKEAEMVKSFASTGTGGGSAAARRILDRNKKIRFAKDISDLKPFIRETCREFEKAFYKGQRILLEGTQGTGLSLYHGNYPYVTSRDTTVAGCLAEAGISPSRVRRVIMVCRTYPIRVGKTDEGNTSGPMSKEISLEDIAVRSQLDLNKLKESERTSTTNRPRRIAEFDWQLFRKAISLNGPTDIAMTFVDYLSAKNTEARRFEQLEEKTLRFIEEVEKVATAPVSLISTRFNFRNIIDRRSW